MIKKNLSRQIINNKKSAFWFHWLVKDPFDSNVSILFFKGLVQKFVLSTRRAVCGPSAAAVGSRGSCCRIKSFCYELRKFTNCSSWHTLFLCFYYQLIYMKWFVVKIFSCAFKWHTGWTPFTPNLYNILGCLLSHVGEHSISCLSLISIQWTPLICSHQLFISHHENVLVCVRHG